MARYTGPLCRLCRRESEKLFLKGDRCYTDKCGVEEESSRQGSTDSVEGNFRIMLSS